MKIALPLMLAWYFQKFEGRIGWKDFVLAAVLIVVPVYLIKRQPDLGTALLIARVRLLRAVPRRTVVEGHRRARGASAPRPRRWSGTHLHDYQRERILTFIDPGARSARRRLSLDAGVDRARLGRRRSARAG